MYDAPISICRENVETSIDNEIFKAIYDVGIYVDKDKLLQALNADKTRYEEAFEQGRIAGIKEVMRALDIISYKGITIEEDK